MKALHIENLNFSYSDRILFEKANAKVYSDGITCIIGCNGSGKSTLLRLLHGLVNPDSGIINWQGFDPRPTISMVFQKPLMLRRSVIANIKFILKLNNCNSDPLTYLQILNLTHLASKPARSLSGGEQQKLAIVRALAQQPDVILLDEPTAHLDQQTASTIEQLLVNLSEQGKKIFLVSHDMSQVKRIAHDVLHVEEGKLKTEISK